MHSRHNLRQCVDRVWLMGNLVSHMSQEVNRGVAAEKGPQGSIWDTGWVESNHLLVNFLDGFKFSFP